MLRIENLQPLFIGRVSDGGVEVVEIDCSTWVAAHPNLALYTLEVTSPNGVVYLPVVEMQDNVLAWRITQADTAAKGQGMYQVVAYGDDGEKKTSSHPALNVLDVMPGTTQEAPPAPSQPWVDEVVKAADRVENVVAHPPIISETGNWMLWDSDSAAYVDSGVKAQGEKGEPGKDAEPYTLPTASETVKGGVMVGEGLRMDGEALGVIPEGEFEHIETIQLTEATTEIVLTEEPDGTPYAFKAAAVRAVVSEYSDNTYKVQTRFYGANNTPHLITLYHGEGIGKAAERRWTAFAIPMYGRMFGYMTTPVAAYDGIPGFSHPSYSYFFGTYAPIGTIRIQSPSGTYPVGTRFEIYGVRENA